MSSESFCFWLQGYFELNRKSDSLSEEQVELIRRHLDLVFAHEIDPKAGGPAVQAKLNKLHGDTILRC